MSKIEQEQDARNRLNPQGDDTGVIYDAWDSGPTTVRWEDLDDCDSGDGGGWPVIPCLP